jgi:hypothetical protein
MKLEPDVAAGLASPDRPRFEPSETATMPAPPNDRPNAPTLRLDAVTLALIVLLIVANLVLAAGDARSNAAHRDRLQLASEPAGAVDVLAARARAAQPDAADRKVVVVGRIGGMPNPWPDMHADYPWYPGQASLLLVDLDTSRQFAAHMKAHGTNTADCMFCRRKAEKSATSIAVVNFVDDAGNILPVDARELLDLRAGQTIVVRGTAELLGGTMLVINADGVYARK